MRLGRAVMEIVAKTAQHRPLFTIGRAISVGQLHLLARHGEHPRLKRIAVLVARCGSVREASRGSAAGSNANTVSMKRFPLSGATRNGRRRECPPPLGRVDVGGFLGMGNHHYDVVRPLASMPRTVSEQPERHKRTYQCRMCPK